VQSGEGDALLRRRLSAALGGMFVLAAVGAWLAGEPYGLIVFLVGGCPIGWVDAVPHAAGRRLG
jgi:hypothetical protein